MRITVDIISYIEDKNMSYYRDAYMAANVSRIIREGMQKMGISTAEFARRAGFESMMQAESLLTGRRHFPLELVKQTARALHLDEGELGYWTLLIYFPIEAMSVNFEAIGAFSSALQHTTPDDARDTAKKKKNKKSRNRS